MNKVLKKCILILVILSINFKVFAAVVSDSDGVAFVSKEEFENIKKDITELGLGETYEKYFFKHKFSIKFKF